MEWNISCVNLLQYVEVDENNAITVTGTVSGTAILDEDNMTSDSATQLATQQSIKAYTDAISTAMAIALG